jgi:LEA14-like dessication related protein
MIKKYWPYLLGAGALLYYFSRLKRTAQNVKVNLANVSLKKGKGISLPVIKMDFEIINPTNTPINVNGVVGDAYVNGQFLATISNVNKVTLPQYGTTIYSVEIKTGAFDAASAFLNLVKKGSGTKGLRITADLNVDVDGIFYPVKIDKVVL